MLPYEEEIEKKVDDYLYITIVDDEDNAGFIFYITFYPRNHDYNIDQVKIGRSTEF